MKLCSSFKAITIFVVAIWLYGCAAPGAVVIPTNNMPKKAEAKSSSGEGAKPIVKQVDAQTKSNFNKAIKYLSSGKLEKAEPLLVQIHQAHPQLAGPLINLGILYTKQGKDDQAIELLTKAIEVNPENNGAYKVLAKIHKEKGEFKEAAAIYQKGLDKDKSDPDINYNLGILYELYLSEPQKAVEHYERYLLSNTEDKKVSAWVKNLKRQIARDSSNKVANSKN